MNKLLFRILTAIAIMLLIVAVVLFARLPTFPAAAVPPVATPPTITIPATVPLTVNQPMNLTLRRILSPRGDCLPTTTGTITGPFPAALVRTPHAVRTGGTVYTLDALLPGPGTYTLTVTDSTAPGETMTLLCMPASWAAASWNSVIILLMATLCGAGLLLLATLFVYRLVSSGRRKADTLVNGQHHNHQGIN